MPENVNESEEKAENWPTQSLNRGAAILFGGALMVFDDGFDSGIRREDADDLRRSPFQLYRDVWERSFRLKSDLERYAYIGMLADYSFTGKTPDFEAMKRAAGDELQALRIEAFENLLLGDLYRQGKARSVSMSKELKERQKRGETSAQHPDVMGRDREGAWDTDRDTDRVGVVEGVPDRGARGASLGGTGSAFDFTLEGCQNYAGTRGQSIDYGRRWYEELLRRGMRDGNGQPITSWPQAWEFWQSIDPGSRY